MNLISWQLTHNITKRKRDIKYIVVHYTAGRTSDHSAETIAKQFDNPKRKASADFVVDDQCVVCVNEDLKNGYCWAVGDGKGKRGIYNRDCVNIEICSNLKTGATYLTPNHCGWYFTETTLENARELIRMLMNDLGIDKDHVIRHYDVSGKACPGLAGWNKGYLYTLDGKRTKERNNEKEWLAFKDSI